MWRLRARRAFLSAIRCSRSIGTATASGTRRNLFLAAWVDSAAAVIKVGVIVHVGSGVFCLGGIEQEAVLVLVVIEATTTLPVLEMVATVLVTVVVTLAGVTVVVGD